jgi:hypothetical protein
MKFSGEPVDVADSAGAIEEVVPTMREVEEPVAYAKVEVVFIA